jgi:hypothetical protein
MSELKRRAGRWAPAAFAACLIAAVSALAIVCQGDLSAPPRYDGAGYAVLARSLLEGDGYRAIDHPDRPRHAHFPPGYPLLLALAWRITGYSPPVAHLLSCLCAVGATLAAWIWFRRLYQRNAALLLAVALSVNWTWVRTGSAIQSEPLFELLCQAAILVAVQSGARSEIGQAAVLGGLLGACLLTRHIALGLTLAVLLDLWLRKRRKAALIALVVSLVLVSPWVVWVAALGSDHRTQASLLVRGNPDLPARLVTQGKFYLERIPDQLTGPIVEFATVVCRSERVERIANCWALLATAIVLAGWLGALRQPRRRLAGLVPLLTLIPLLVWPYTEAGRFLIPLIPCLLIGAMEGVTGLCGRISRTLGPGIPNRRVRIAVGMSILAASLLYPTYRLLLSGSRAGDANSEFDAACAWLVRFADHPGPVLTRHPGEVFLATGRHALAVSTSERPGDTDADPDAIAKLIRRYQVAFLLVDEDRYLQAAPSPLRRFVEQRSGRVRNVWSEQGERSRVTIYEVMAADADTLPASP